MRPFLEPEAVIFGVLFTGPYILLVISSTTNATQPACHHSSFGIREIITSSSQQRDATLDYEKFCRYISGLWIVNEEEQVRDRYKAFMSKAAAEADGSQCCVSLTKLGEDAYEKVFSEHSPCPRSYAKCRPPFKMTASDVFSGTIPAVVRLIWSTSTWRKQWAPSSLVQSRNLPP